jgi:hypothetical protein
VAVHPLIDDFPYVRYYDTEGEEVSTTEGEDDEYNSTIWDGDYNPEGEEVSTTEGEDDEYNSTIWDGDYNPEGEEPYLLERSVMCRVLNKSRCKLKNGYINRRNEATRPLKRAELESGLKSGRYDEELSTVQLYSLVSRVVGLRVYHLEVGAGLEAFLLFLSRCYLDECIGQQGGLLSVVSSENTSNTQATRNKYRDPSVNMALISVSVEGGIIPNAYQICRLSIACVGILPHGYSDSYSGSYANPIRL